MLCILLNSKYVISATVDVFFLNEPFDEDDDVNEHIIIDEYDEDDDNDEQLCLLLIVCLNIDVSIMIDDNDESTDDIVEIVHIDQSDCLDVWFILNDVSDNLYLNLKKMFIYIKNDKILACSKDWTLKIWKPYEVELEWYYKVKDWKPYMITSEQELPGAFFVWDRNREEFYRKRQLCIELTEEEKKEYEKIEEERRKKIEENAKKWLDEYWNPLEKENVEKEENVDNLNEE